MLSRVFFATLFLCFSCSFYSQVKIGDNPNTINVNSILELESTNKGLLPPRVTLVNTNSVSPLTSSTPAGMLVYNAGGAVAEGYYTWNGTKWLAITTGNNTRSNFVLVKTAADLPAPVGGVITLSAGTLYEFNGTVNLTSMIDLNGCNIRGSDPTNDKLTYTGAGSLFTGSGTGSIRLLTLTSTGGSIFGISGGATPKNLLVQNCYILSSTSVGTIQNIVGTVFFSNVAYFYNLNGITFSTCSNVVLNTTLWDNSNVGTFEKFTGSFNVIQLLGGDRLVNIGSTALDVSAVTTVTAGTVKALMFVGAGTFVNGTFSDKWEIESSGLDTQKDDVAAGNLYLTNTVTTNFTAANFAVKAACTTTAVNVFRMSAGAIPNTSNQLVYTGAKKRRFQVICSITVTPGMSNQVYSFFIAKNGVIMPESRQAIKLGNNTDQQSVTVACTVELSTGQYVELYTRNDTGTGSILVTTFNLAAK